MILLLYSIWNYAPHVMGLVNCKGVPPYSPTSGLVPPYSPTPVQSSAVESCSPAGSIEKTIAPHSSLTFPLELISSSSRISLEHLSYRPSRRGRAYTLQFVGSGLVYWWLERVFWSLDLLTYSGAVHIYYVRRTSSLRAVSHFRHWIEWNNTSASNSKPLYPPQNPLYPPQNPLSPP